MAVVIGCTSFLLHYCPTHNYTKESNKPPPPPTDDSLCGLKIPFIKHSCEITFWAPEYLQKPPGIWSDTFPKPHSLFICDIWTVVPVEQRSALCVWLQEFSHYTLLSWEEKKAQTNACERVGILTGSPKQSSSLTHLWSLDHMLT